MRTLIPLFVTGWFSIAVIATLGACGTQATTPGPVDSRTSIYPAGRNTLLPSDLAFGGGPWTSSGDRGRIGMSEEELATYLKPPTPAKAAHTRTPPAPPASPERPEPLPALPPFSAAVARTPEPTARTEQQVPAAPAGPRTANPDAARYAQREQRASALADYRGGDVVVISVTTLVIILLIVLILVLLT